MKPQMMKTLRHPLFSVLLMAVLVVSVSAADLKVVVKVNTANVRLKAAVDSPVVGKAPMGLILTVREKTEGWYLVELPPDDKGVAVRGYIHESVVQEFAEGKPVITPKPAAKPAPVRKPARKASPESGKKLYVRLGAGYGTKTFDYSNTWTFAMYQETGQVTENYAVDASGVVFDAGVGFMITPSVGVELSFVPASGKTKGTFSGNFPHPLYFDAARQKSWEDGGLKYSASELNLDLLYAFAVTGRIKATVMAGGTYFMGVKVKSLKSVSWNETAYPYFDLNVTPVYGNYSASAFGFNGGAGLDYRLSGSLSANITARYSSGTAKIKIEAMEVSVPAGGLRATAGIKIGF